MHGDPAETPQSQQTAPEQGSTQPGRSITFTAPPAILPVPGNAELLVFVLVELMFAIIWWTSDAVNAGDFVLATAIVTFAYLVSRGIAKASRVYEQ